MSIVTYPLNGITYDASDAETYLCTRSSGVFSSEDCFDISITGNMTVSVSTGLAWIKNDDFKGKSVHMNEAAELEISIGAASYGRIDRIVLRFSAANNETTLEVVEGTASSSPAAPDITQEAETYELGLYTISVPAGTTELSASNITDTRMDEDVCGLMADSVTEVPTATLYAQITEMISTLQDEIDSVEDGSGYMLQSVYDEDGGAKQVAFADTAVTHEANTIVGTGSQLVFVQTTGNITTSTVTHGSYYSPVYLTNGAIASCAMSFAYGSITINVDDDDIGVPVSVTVELPDERFQSAPYVVVTPATSVPGTKVLGVGVQNVTTESFDVYLTRADAYDTVVHWIAIGPRYIG